MREPRINKLELWSKSEDNIYKAYKKIQDAIWDVEEFMEINKRGIGNSDAKDRLAKLNKITKLIINSFKREVFDDDGDEI